MIWKQISDVVEFIRNGASIKQESGKGGYPITRIETIWNKTIDTDKFGYADIFDDTLESYAKYIMKDGDLLITHINSPKHLGKCAIYEGVPDKLIHGMNLLGLRAKENVSVPKYLKYFFNSDFFKLQLPKISNQSVNQASFSAGNLNKLKIPLPPLYQQKKIAAILDAADTYRQKTKALIEKYDELTQSLFLNMFGDPMINPRGWQFYKLGLLVENKDSKRVPIKSSDRDKMSGKFPYYGASRVIDYVDDYTHEGDNLLVGEDGANLLARSTPIAFIAKGRYWVNNHAHVLGYNGKALLVFLEFYINLINLSPYISGSAQPKLNRKNMDQIEVYCPPLKLQNQFAERVQAIEKQKSQAQASLAQAEDLFNSLLQRAFKGELTN